jgi:hypothetical protein
MTYSQQLIGQFSSVSADDLLSENILGCDDLEIVLTRYVGPTDENGSHVVARSICSDAWASEFWNYGRGTEANHLAAAVAALQCSRSQWRLIGRVDNGDGYCCVFAEVRSDA